MSPTSTSDPAHDEALQRIIGYFILRRGRGSAISSRDADALETWAREGHTWMDILHAIDRAFAKMRTPPQSLRACGTYLVRSSKGADDLLDPDILAAAFGAPPPTDAPTTPTPAAPKDNAQPAAVQDALAHLQHHAERCSDPRAKNAYIGLYNEIQERAEEGPLPPETIAVFDEALALLALEQLAPPQRRALEARIEAAPATMRTRTLLEEAGRALSLVYPRLGKI